MTTLSPTTLTAAEILYRRSWDTIAEGVFDPGLLKAVFMAGGPGSGKSYAAADLFAIDKNSKQSFSDFGLKVVSSDIAFEFMLKKHGIDPKHLATIERDNPKLWHDLTVAPDSVRNRAKSITIAQREFYNNGRLGMIIDGTGEDFDKVAKQRQATIANGYDTFMVFVFTPLELALQRNSQRDRVLPDIIVRDLWAKSMENMEKFRGLFGQGNFVSVNSTDSRAEAQKFVNVFLRRPIQNPLGRRWIEAQQQVSKFGLQVR
jgi:cytidylate kinase